MAVDGRSPVCGALVVRETGMERELAAPPASGDGERAPRVDRIDTADGDEFNERGCAVVSTADWRPGVRERLVREWVVKDVCELKKARGQSQTMRGNRE